MEQNDLKHIFDKKYKYKLIQHKEYRATFMESSVLINKQIF